jgi:uncharacterized protein (DUF1499 family)
MNLLLVFLLFFPPNLVGPTAHLTFAPTQLAPCPNSPNCVSTQEVRKRKRMAPLLFSGTAESALGSLEEMLANYPQATLVEKEGLYLHYEFQTSIGNFIDDVEFLLDADTQQIHFRSASRVGYGDFGKNRRRMKKIRKEWNAFFGF